VLGSEPSRGFFDEGKDAQHQPDGDKLETDGDTPLDGSTRGVHELHTVGDPVRDGNTGDDDDLEKTAR
jgi:hypothetical protein